MTPDDNFELDASSSRADVAIEGIIALLRRIPSDIYVISVPPEYKDTSLKFRRMLEEQQTIFRSEVVDGKYFQALDRLSEIRDFVISSCAPFINDVNKIIPDAPKLVRANAEQLQRNIESISTALLRFENRISELARREIAPQVPREMPAPIRVKIEDDRIVLSNQQSLIGPLNLQSLENVKRALATNVSNVIDDLSLDSNIDKRLIKVFNTFLEALSEDSGNSSIEAIGIQLQLVERLTDKYRQEINDIVLEQIDHVVENTKILLTQFEEWRSFLEEAKKLKSAGINGSELVQRSEIVTSELEKHPNIVDQGITRRLRDMIEPVTSGILQADAISAPLVASLSNIFSAISMVVIDASNYVSTQTGLTTIFASSHLLVPFCIKVIRTFFPMFSHFQPLKFVVSTLEYIEKRYSQIKDVFNVG